MEAAAPGATHGEIMGVGFELIAREGGILYNNFMSSGRGGNDPSDGLFRLPHLGRAGAARGWPVVPDRHLGGMARSTSLTIRDRSRSAGPPRPRSRLSRRRSPACRAELRRSGQARLRAQWQRPASSASPTWLFHQERFLGARPRPGHRLGFALAGAGRRNGTPARHGALRRAHGRETWLRRRFRRNRSGHRQRCRASEHRHNSPTGEVYDKRTGRKRHDDIVRDLLQAGLPPWGSA